MHGHPFGYDDKMDLSLLPIEHSPDELFCNSNPEGETPFEDFWHVRGELLAACQQFGRTGPEDVGEESFYLVDDQYNDDLYQYLAIHNANAVSLDWLRAIIEVLSAHPGWAVSVGLRNSKWVLLFANRIVVHGGQFAACDSVESVLHELAKDAATG